MKNINKFMGLMAILAFTLLGSCTKDQGVSTKDSTINLKATEVEASLKGGTYAMEYTISSPHEGEVVTATAADDWVYDFDNSVDGVLSFKVKASEDGKSRETIVTVKYRFAYSANFTVKQGSNMTDKKIKIELVETNLFDFTVKFIPEDKTKPYIIQSDGKLDLILNNITTGEQLYENDFAYFNIACGWYGQSVVQFMQSIAKMGDHTQIVKNGTSGGTYTVHAYYFDYKTGALVSEVATLDVTTKTPEKVTAEFDMTFEVDGTEVTATVTPKNPEETGDYYFDILNGVILNGFVEHFDNEAAFMEYFWANSIFEMTLNEEMSAEQIIGKYSCVGNDINGNPMHTCTFELLANWDYYLFAFKMDPETGLCKSVPQWVKISTGDAKPSDISVGITYTNITSYSATATVTPSNNDYYICNFVTTEEWNALGADDAARKAKILADGNWELTKGNDTYYLSNLTPGTEYVGYAFGSRGGVATNDRMDTFKFTTKSDEYSDLTFELADLGYYAANELANVDDDQIASIFSSDAIKDQVVFPIRPIVKDKDGNVLKEGDYKMFLYDYYYADSTDALYGDKEWTDHFIYLMQQVELGVLQGGFAENTYYFAPWDENYIFLGVVIDNDGYMSKRFERRVTPNLDGAGDVADFITWWYEWHENSTSGPGLQ